MLVNGGRTDRSPVFQIRVIRSEVQNVLDDGRLAVLVVGLRFREKRGDVSGRGVSLRGWGRLLSIGRSGDDCESQANCDCTHGNLQC